MNHYETLLTNAGLIDVKSNGDFISFQDPSCILPAFDQILNYAWIAIVVLTAFMLLGWAMLYIKNGVNINNVFNNAKTIILIFCVLSVVKPIVNIVYGDNLFARGCETKTVSVASVQDLLNMRQQNLSESEDSVLFESFNVTDSGPATFDNNQ